MKTKLIASYIAAAALLLPLAGYGADSAKTFVKDSAITMKIKAELAEEKASSLVKIGVDTTDKGAVVLTGNAANKAAVDRAVAIAKAVKGVTSVENNIKIKADDSAPSMTTKVDATAHSMKTKADESAHSVKTYVKDSVITTKIKAELVEEKVSSLVKIGVDTTDKGVVVLTGTAANQVAIDRAVAIAKAVKGVTSVENNIKIKADK